jgi:hypothetical protein
MKHFFMQKVPTGERTNFLGKMFQNPNNLFQPCPAVHEEKSYYDARKVAIKRHFRSLKSSLQTVVVLRQQNNRRMLLSATERGSHQLQRSKIRLPPSHGNQ